MSKKVSVELFRFNANDDYLPYYKKYEISYSDSETLLDMLNKINDIEKFDYKNSNDFNIKINNLYVNVATPISKLVELASAEFQIEPISVFRATSDLIINNEDYIHKMEVFSEYVSDEQMQAYKKEYELDYYASNSYNFNKDYIGDSSILIASDIIEKTPQNRDKMIDYISREEDGIWYHTALSNRVFNYDDVKEQKIQALLSSLPKIKKSKIELSEPRDAQTTTISQYFDGFNIASFEGLTQDSCSSLINDSKASYVDISLKNEDLAPYSTLVNKDFSLYIAGDILLQAKDENADFLIVRDSKDIELFDEKQSSISKVMGREIDMPVISQEQFIQLLGGEKDSVALGFDKHKVNVSFL